MSNIRPSDRPIIYIAGPLAANKETERTKELNINLANAVGRGLYELTQDKVDIFIPHNMHTPLGDCIKSLPEEYFYSLDLGLLEMFIASGRHFCIYLMRDWEMSVGAIIEEGFVRSMLAMGLYIKIATSKIDVKEWLQELGII